MTLRVTRSDLVTDVSDKTGFRRSDIEAIVGAYEDATRRALASGAEVYLHGFGTFDVRIRDARRGRNPRTGEAIALPATATMRFRPSKPLRDAVARGAA